MEEVTMRSARAAFALREHFDERLGRHKAQSGQKNVTIGKDAYFTWFPIEDQGCQYQRVKLVLIKKKSNLRVDFWKMLYEEYTCLHVSYSSL